MGLFGKIKNIFYDEEIVEVEVPTVETKKEASPRIEEIHLPKREAVKAPEVSEAPKPTPPVYTERELFKTENTFKFPVIDEDEEDTPVRTRTRSNILDIERPARREIKESKPEVKYTAPTNKSNGNGYNNNYNNHEKSGEKVFKPSPVISPVYGVLDKNYKKEEIIERQHSIRHNQADMNYDSIRRKAYGTLEDELENTLSKISSKTDQVMQTIKEVEDLDTESNSKSIEDLLNEIEGNRETQNLHDLKNVTIGELEERIKDTYEEDEEPSFVKSRDEFERMSSKSESAPVKEEPVKESTPVEPQEEDGFDKTLEHDLFNLIDSMYEEREGE